MADNEVQYEFKTVRAIRGAEARTTAKWEKEGWEPVSQDKGTLRSEITFRRPVRKLPLSFKAMADGAVVLLRKLPLRVQVVAGGFVVLLIALAITVGVIQEGDGDAVASPAQSPSSSSEPAPEPSMPAQVAPSEQASEKPEAVEPEDEILTVENSSELAALLAEGDYCSDSIAGFAAQYQGKTIAFDGSIGAMNPHGGYKTRYDILIGAGDFSETSASGPNFQFRDVNTTSDLHFPDSDLPDTIGVRDNFRITAQVGKYEDNSCLFLLEPVETEFR